MHTSLDSIAAALQSKKRVLVATHVNPDGDAIGSAAAMAHTALHHGSEARILLLSGLPGFLSWLPLPCPWVRDIAELGDWAPDLLAVVDCGDAKRTGPALNAFFSQGALPAPGWEKTASINIDHHLGNPEFASLNWVDHTRSATGEMIGLLAERCGMPLTGDLALAVYLALVADTGGFSFSNTSADCLSMAARIVAGGLDVASFTNRYENVWSLARMRLWGRLLGEVTLHADGAVACAIVPKAYLEESGLGRSSLDGFAAWLRRLQGVRVGLFVREDEPSLCKISLRSMGDVDVRTVAVHFGGGGHAAASGTEIALPPQQAADAVLRELLPRMQAQ